ncbi:MAG: serine hydrolase domain-containing protein [Candidatus Edwardsbacteria bacterium]|nr:serine hydrolase domain-containing protein [Candidatus Edwardsbacteria bacterium]
MLPDSEPGASVIITHGNRIIFDKYYGLADLESGQKLNSGHVLGIASMSKQFTGMAVLFLVQEGKLKLDDDITKYFPELPLAGRKITIQQLLSHTSGLPELTQNDEFMNSIDKAHTVDQIIDLAFKGEFRGEPGEKYIYCNTGYTIIVALIEKLSKMDYAAFLKEKIFKPLKMNDTYACDFKNDAVNAVQRYLPDSAGFRKARVMHFSNLIGGGGVISNSRDMAKWEMALLSGKKLPQNYQKLWEPILLNSGKSTDYGLGLGVSDLDGKKFYYHPGMGDGMNSIDLIFPDYDLTITVIRNISKPKHSSNDISLLAAKYLLTNE